MLSSLFLSSFVSVAGFRDGSDPHRLQVLLVWLKLNAERSDSRLRRVPRACLVFEMAIVLESLQAILVRGV